MRRFRFKISQFMIFTAIVAVVLAMFLHVTAGGILLVYVMFYAALFRIFLWRQIRPSRLKAVMANPPADPNELLASLEWGLASIWLPDLRTTAAARYRLMEL